MLHGKVRNVLLLLMVLTAFSGLALADYYLRHEVTGKTRRNLLASGISLDADAAVRAAENGNLTLLESLERVGIDLGKQEDATGVTPLQSAVRLEKDKVVEFLLRRQSVIRTLDHKRYGDGKTAMLLALKYWNLPIAKKLIEAGAEMGSHWEEGIPLVVAAIKKDDVQLFDFLLKQKVSVKEKDDEGFTALVLAVKERKSDWVVRLLEAGANVDQAGVTGEALLLEVVRSGRRELTKTLIDHGAAVDAKNKAGETALMVVVGNKDRESISILLRAGAKANALDAKGRSIPDHLIEDGDIGMVEFFATETDGGITDAWMVKVFEAGKTELLEGLLRKGGQVEADVEKGGRLLKRAVLKKNQLMVDLLLKFDADPKGEVWDALASGDRAILEKLLEGGADANESLVVGLGSPLSLALRQRRYDSAALLLQYGADPDPWQADGESLIEKVRSRGDERAVSILRDYCANYQEAVYPQDEAENQDDGLIK